MSLIAFLIAAGLICMFMAIFTAAKVAWTVGIILLVAAAVVWLLDYARSRP